MLKKVRKPLWICPYDGNVVLRVGTCELKSDTAMFSVTV